MYPIRDALKPISSRGAPHFDADGGHRGCHLRPAPARAANGLNLTQGELAERCGSNHPFISNLERGVKVPSLTMILRLAEALECRVVDLVQVFDTKHSRR
jgi:DNA-binding XRE family transcriptional regulator